jgi:hydrogenase-4 component F
MNTTGNLLWLLVALPLLGCLAALLLPSVRAVLRLVSLGVPAISALSLGIVFSVFDRTAVFTSGEWLLLDALSAFHLLGLYIIFSLSSVYAGVYFRHEPEGQQLSIPLARRFGALWFATLATMALVLLSNNLGIMWVGVETTTLVTAFLICLHTSPVSLEATWKYLVVCSVGVAFAFMGILLIGAAVEVPGGVGAHVLQWSEVVVAAPNINPQLAKLAFIFLLVGYGTKVGLAPLHSWLPDAHSQAPAPVSAMFSGFLLNMALYCIMRYIPIVEQAPGCAGWAHGLLVVLGMVSIGVAAVFIISQHDLKRLLAYHSVEHLGIIALGLGLGRLGVIAALFHTLNHSICKALGFFSAGRLGQIYGTHDMRRIHGAMSVHPTWGIGMFGSILALIGVAPFAIFMSEFLIIKAAVESHAYWVLALFLAGAATVFIGALKHAVDMSWGEPSVPASPQRASVAERALVFLPMGALLVLGLWMPPPLWSFLEAAADVLKVPTP